MKERIGITEKRDIAMPEEHASLLVMLMVSHNQFSVAKNGKQNDCASSDRFSQNTKGLQDFKTMDDFNKYLKSYGVAIPESVAESLAFYATHFDLVSMPTGIRNKLSWNRFEGIEIDGEYKSILLLNYAFRIASEQLAMESTEQDDLANHLLALAESDWESAYLAELLYSHLTSVTIVHGFLNLGFVHNNEAIEHLLEDSMLDTLRQNRTLEKFTQDLSHDVIAKITNITQSCLLTMQKASGSKPNSVQFSSEFIHNAQHDGEFDTLVQHVLGSGISGVHLSPTAKLIHEDVFRTACKLLNDKQVKEALSLFAYASLHDHWNSHNWLGMGICLSILGKFKNAVEALSFAALCDYKDPRPPIVAALAYLISGNTEKAFQAIEDAKALVQTKTEYASLLSYVLSLSDQINGATSQKH